MRSPKGDVVMDLPRQVAELDNVSGDQAALRKSNYVKPVSDERVHLELFASKLTLHKDAE